MGIVRSVLMLSTAIAGSLPLLTAGQTSEHLLQDGNALLTVCAGMVANAESKAGVSTADLLNSTSCNAFLRGVIEGVAMVSSQPGGGSRYCLPDGVLAVQTARVVVKWLREHP